MSETFNCPSCGAPLEIEGHETTIHCEYCGETVIVPENLRTANPPTPVAAQPQSGSAQSGQAFQPESFRGKMAPSQLRQMMMAVRSGQPEEAAKLFQAGTGVSQEEARQTVDLIANQLSGTNRILPAELAALMMGAIAQSARSYNQPLQPTAPIRPRRRSNFGCLVVLLAIITALYLSYTALSPSQLLKSLISGKVSDQVRLTAVAPISQVKTALATQISSLLSGNTTSRVSAAPLMVFGSEGAGLGTMKDSRSIAVDGQGHIYVGEYTGGKVQVFDNQGKLLSQWTVDAKLPLLSLTVSPQGTVYIVQGGKIQTYQGLTGKPLAAISAPSASGFSDVVMTASGELAAAENGSHDNILIFNPQGSVSLTISNAISSQSGNPEQDTRLAVDSEGNIYALGTLNQAVFKFSPSGKFLNRFGSQGEGNGQFQTADAIAVDGQGQVYVSDSKGIQVFDANGQYLKTIQLPDGVPFGMAFDPSGNLWVTNRTNIYKYPMP